MALLTDQHMAIEIGYHKRDLETESRYYRFDFKWLGKSIFSRDVLCPCFEPEGKIWVGDFFPQDSLIPFLEEVLRCKKDQSVFSWVNSDWSHWMNIHVRRCFGRHGNYAAFDFELNSSLLCPHDKQAQESYASIHVKLALSDPAILIFLEHLKEEYRQFDEAYRIYHEFYIDFNYTGKDTWELFRHRFRRYMQSELYYLSREVTHRRKTPTKRFRCYVWGNGLSSWPGANGGICQAELQYVREKLLQEFPVEISDIQFKTVSSFHFDEYIPEV